jgi:glucose/arabinose dehydrogenase
MRIISGLMVAWITVGALSLTACGGGGGGNGSGNAMPADTTPDQFTFTDQTGVPQSTPIISAPITITGISAPAPISVSGGEYSLGCSANYVSTAGSVSPNQQVCVRQMSAAADNTSTETILTVGGVSATFTSTTGVAPVSIRVERVFPGLAFTQPVAMLQVPGDATRWFVVEQGGVIRVFANSDNVANSSVVLDISARVGDSSGERGLLGLAFDPAFASNGYVYVNYTQSSTELASHISRFTSADGGATLDPASEVILLTLPQPYPNHNGGTLVFGPDGLLYIGFGDGGSADDPQNRAQDTANLWGKILRIDGRAVPYTIPADNPFAGNARCNAGTGDAACPEIFAWGLRNPWKFSFDRATGALYAGDVGQDSWEEVDLIENGNNYGWRIREGAHCNIPAVNCPTAGLTDPIVDYDRTVGTTVTGGYVYHGSAINGLTGSYVFGDFGSGRIFRLANGEPPLDVLLETQMSISSFAQDTDGELYLLSYGDGKIYKIVQEAR